MEKASEVHTTGTSDFVVDLLSGAQIESTSDRSALPPKPAPRRRNRRPKDGRQVAENNSVRGGGSTIKQTLPPGDETLLVNAQPVPRLAEDVVNEPVSRYVSASGVNFTAGEVNNFQPCDYKRETTAKPHVTSPAQDYFDNTHLVSISSSAGCGDELLLASVPYHTLRIEPSPALTLDTRKHQSLRANADGSHSGRLKSSGSLSDDNLQEMSFGEPTRSSSTPTLIGDGGYNDVLLFLCDKLPVNTADCETLSK